MNLKIRCETCKTTIQFTARRNSGCGCDPDAPTWCYIDNQGIIRGLSSARWTQIDDNE